MLIKNRFAAGGGQRVCVEMENLEKISQYFINSPVQSCLQLFWELPPIPRSHLFDETSLVTATS